jgi:hypothetical protein
MFIYPVDIPFLEAHEQEEVELTILGGSLVDRFLDEANKILLAHILRVATQVIL